jgi:serine O-acetyltransferase
MRLTWRDTRALLAEDRSHLIERLGGQPPPVWLIAYPPYLCVWLYRVSRLLASRRHRRLARLVRFANVLVTGADIDPAANLGGGFVVLSPPAVSVAGIAGRNLVMGPLTGLGGERSQADIGAGPGLPVLGDDVQLGALSGVLGPARVGSRVRVGPGCVVTRDVPDGARLEAQPPRFLAGP